VNEGADPRPLIELSHPCLTHGCGETTLEQICKRGRGACAYAAALLLVEGRAGAAPGYDTLCDLRRELAERDDEPTVIEVWAAARAHMSASPTGRRCRTTG
jgi:hypothetical protein